MNCPRCDSDQTTHYTLRYCAEYLECVNCDYEGIIHDNPGDLVDLAMSNEHLQPSRYTRR